MGDSALIFDMNLPTITTISEDQRQLALSILTLSFVSDPVMRWIFPSAGTYAQVFPDFVNAFGGAAIGGGTGFIADGYCGAALWFVPGLQSDEEGMAALMAEHASEAVMADMPDFMEQMDSCHPDDDNCWYLPIIGVDAAHQGNGLGAALMKHALAQVDEAGGCAYLESSNPQNVSLYQRHGFEIIGSIQAGSSPEMYPMLRAARV